MRREDISDALDMLEEEMLAHTDMVRQRAEQVKHPRLTKQVTHKTFSWKNWSTMAAGLCLICLAAIVVITVSWRNAAKDSFYQGGAANVRGIEGIMAEENDFGKTLYMQNSADANSQGTEEGDTLKQQEPFVPVSYLLASVSPKSGMIKEMAAAHVRVSIGEYMGIYEKVSSIDSAVLADSIGREVDGAKDWHYISGHQDLQYLIREENQEYSLWKFGYFDSEEYPYSDVLQLVYKIESAERITAIEVKPAQMDNTDEGKRIQQEIGTRTIANRDEINTLYQVLCTMTCYGSDRWDLIDYGNVEAAADTGLSDHAAVWLGRYMTLTMDNGNEIDGLKYTAVSGMFYEFSGVAYNRLTTEQAQSISSILGIAKEQQVPLGEREPKQLPQQDSVFLLRAENTGASLEDVTELQTKVSNAMVNHELPFVTSSAVYENPYRLHVTVTTKAEEELEKLIAMDEKGGIMEIEYGAENRIELY